MSGPGEQVAEWVGAEVGAFVPLGSRDGGPWRVAVGGTEVVVKVGRRREPFVVEVAALERAAAFGVAAPRVLAADLGGGLAGHFGVVTSVVRGSSRIPVDVRAGRLRELGAAAARLHRVVVEPTAELPLRERAIEDVDFAADWRERGPAELLEEAEQVLEGFDRDGGPRVFLHGDLWQGNTMWVGDSCTGMVDWDGAGTGPSGVDVGSMRCDAAILHGLGAADLVLDGWEREAGSRAPDVARWDVVAALGTPADLGDWLPVIHGQGRGDLDARTATARRDEFLRAALGR
ncbi:aminoglycoside phosphotransferase family protein [Umezawaea tangerina]|uniref:Phosphotransferase family enzyme n=1 Tax=Umezawaea tangerina TaxID=84725 RepID=A0A2T0SSA7_9PSEU|nr:aminoglycoside phosphotransferase family protein [Umezawaea tangerina]PRY36286.1 phosphotransferase family enzyme [Umezawaea tangerina]